MLRRNVRLAGPALALTLALSASWCLAGAEPPERLTLESFNKVMKIEKARAGSARDPNLERSVAMHGDPDTIRRWAAQLEADKNTSDAIKSAGMTPQEYTRTLVALMQAYGVSGLKKQNKTVPENLMAQVPPENVAFVDRHAAEIESWGKTSGKDVKPNTMEDLYVEQETPAAADAPKTAETDKAAPAAKPAAATTKTTSPAKTSKETKDSKPAPNGSGSDKP